MNYFIQAFVDCFFNTYLLMGHRFEFMKTSIIFFLLTLQRSTSHDLCHLLLTFANNSDPDQVQ